VVIILLAIAAVLLLLSVALEAWRK